MSTPDALYPLLRPGPVGAGANPCLVRAVDLDTLAAVTELPFPIADGGGRTLGRITELHLRTDETGPVLLAAIAPVHPLRTPPPGFRLALLPALKVDAHRLPVRLISVTARLEAIAPAVPAEPSPPRQREPWDAYFLRIATDVASRATCDRRHVGCVLVRDHCILATGYNGSIRGLAHCDDAGHLLRDDHCARTVHAEANAITQAARNGQRVEGATAYITDFPCYGCFKLLANAGVARIVYGAEYRPDEQVLLDAAALSLPLDLVRLP